jgi:hypothetical protein
MAAAMAAAAAAAAAAAEKEGEREEEAAVVEMVTEAEGEAEAAAGELAAAEAVVEESSDGGRHDSRAKGCGTCSMIVRDVYERFAPHGHKLQCTGRTNYSRLCSLPRRPALFKKLWFSKETTIAKKLYKAVAKNI